mgnify:CR=1 FL=1
MEALRKEMDEIQARRERDEITTEDVIRGVEILGEMYSIKCDESIKDIETSWRLGIGTGLMFGVSLGIVFAASVLSMGKK